MESFTNDKGEEIVIADMDNHRLINSIAKYADVEDTVQALKKEAVYRLYAYKRIEEVQAENIVGENETDRYSAGVWEGLRLAKDAVNKKSNS